MDSSKLKQQDDKELVHAMNSARKGEKVLEFGSSQKVLDIRSSVTTPDQMIRAD